MFKNFRLLPMAVFYGILIINAMSITSASGADRFQVKVSYQSDYQLPQGDSSILRLNSITVSAGIQQYRRSPLRLTNVDTDEIKFRATGKTFTEILDGISGVYATRESGSYGDAKINIRGFKQENISVLLNGIPISGLTSGSMFWNNWMGLADATASIQLQKGIGASMLSDNSVGGTINIITAQPSDRRGYEVGFYLSDYGTYKTNINYNSGLLSRGWSFSAMASYASGKGYVDATKVNSFAYLFSLNKQIGDKHSFNFTALGSPERHQQRSYRNSYSETEQYGRDYNKGWGWYNGEIKTISENNYFKPYFTLSHNYKSGSSVSFNLNNALYFAVGDGGGLYPETKDYSSQIISFTKEGQIDWNGVIANNKNKGDITERGISATNIISDYNAGHWQAGIKSSASLKFKSGNDVEIGVHYQHYDKWENETIKDLLGADYWYEDYANSSLAGVVGRDPYKGVGDRIRTDNGADINVITFYGASTLNFGSKWILKVGASVSTSSIKRWDKYNYIDDIYSRVANGTGGSGKAGLLLNISPSSSIYVNMGVYSRAPYSSLYFSSGNNTITKNVKNENNYLSEIGYRFVADRIGAEATFYTAAWRNKTLTSDKYKPLNGDEQRYMVTGLNAFHYGIEFDGFYNFSHFAKLNLFASIASWKWTNDVHAVIYDPYSQQELGKIDLYSNGLHVGDAPQTQVGASLQVKPLKKLVLRAEWRYNDRFWADFDPSKRTNPDDKSDSYRIPAYHLVNLNASYLWNVNRRIALKLFCNINNVFNESYIERSKDGSGHDKSSFTGYWGAPRNFNCGMSLSF